MRTGWLEQATRLPTIAQPNHCHRRRCMTLILLEALAAGALLVLIVWWTMFSGRDKGEPRQDPPGASSANTSDTERSASTPHEPEEPKH